MHYKTNILLKLGNFLIRKASESKDDIRFVIKFEITREILDNIINWITSYRDVLNERSDAFANKPRTHDEGIRDIYFKIIDFLTSVPITVKEKAYNASIMEAVVLRNIIVKFDGKLDAGWYTKEQSKFLKKVNSELLGYLDTEINRYFHIDQEIDKKMSELIEQDWRPNETIPEDYYAL